MTGKKRLQKIIFPIALLAMGMSVVCCIMNPSHEFVLSKSELEREKLKAVRGDVKATERVSDHYGLGKNDIANEKIWNTIGAENGNNETTYGLIIVLTWNKDDGEAYTRGIYWLYSLASIRYRETESWLERLGYTLETAKPPSDSLYPPKQTLTPSDVDRYKDGALRGSGQAALVLANYLGATSHTEESEYWYRIGAQNGNVECMRQYGGILFGKEEMLDQERGKFWLGRADGE